MLRSRISVYLKCLHLTVGSCTTSRYVFLFCKTLDPLSTHACAYKNDVEQCVETCPWNVTTRLSVHAMLAIGSKSKKRSCNKKKVSGLGYLFLAMIQLLVYLFTQM